MAKSKKESSDTQKPAEDSLAAEDRVETGEGGPAEDSLPVEESLESADAADTVAETSDDSVSAAPDPDGDPLAGTGEAADNDTPVADDVDGMTGLVGDTLAGAADPDSLVGEGEDTLTGSDTAEPPAGDPIPASAPTPEPQVVRETVVERKGGFMSMLLGGVVAAGLGYAAGAYPDLPFMGPGEEVEDPFVTQTNAALRAQGEQLETLATKADATAAKADATAEAVDGIDLAPLSTGLAGLETRADALDTALAALNEQLKAYDVRITALEKQPLVDAVSPETIAAYERELEALRASVTAQQAAIEAAQKDQLATMDAAKAEIQAMADRARAAEASAQARATLAANRAALAALTASARAGEPYAEPLSILTANGVAVPDALAQGAAEGLPTDATLISEFPEAARAALQAARSADLGDAGGDAGGLAGFLERQLGARSVTPRAGDDPDAILSRAEAAVRRGDLDTALTEISALPDVAQGPLADWVALAGLRRDALAATALLSQELNQE